MADLPEVKSEYLLGLQPDDRKPNDWLRMVSRVFAAHRAEPLKRSIVSYIDGLMLSLHQNQPGNYNSEIRITGGQAFVDDQFIGFVKKNENDVDLYSSIGFNKRDILPGIDYCIVLHYQWIEQYPPEEPLFRIVDSTKISDEHDLCLGILRCVDHDNDPATECILELIDCKKPWWRTAVEAMIGNTEVDGPEKLPYLVAIKNGTSADGLDSRGCPIDNPYPGYEGDLGTMDIGWAIDFHKDVGNQINYDFRLHTMPLDDVYMYINNKKIFSETPYNPDPLFWDPNDAVSINGASPGGDMTTEFGNNITIVDSYNPSVSNLESDSGKGCYSIKLENTNITKGASFCSQINAAGEIQAGIEIKDDYYDTNSVINNLTLTSTPDIVTINDNPIWNTFNNPGTGLNIIFLGFWPKDLGGGNTEPQPLSRTMFNGKCPMTGTGGAEECSLQAGDMYYDNTTESYWYHDGTVWVQIGATETMKNYRATGGSLTIVEDLNRIIFNPAFTVVTVDGATLTPIKDYDNTTINADGMVHGLDLTKILTDGEEVNVYTVFSGKASGNNLNSLSDVSLPVGGLISEGEVLTYNWVDQKWGNKPVIAPVQKLDSLSDVNDTRISGDQNMIMTRSDENSDWETVELDINKLSDVDTTALQVGDTLQWDGNDWVPITGASGNFLSNGGAQTIIVENGLITSIL